MEINYWLQYYCPLTGSNLIHFLKKMISLGHQKVKSRQFRNYSLYNYKIYFDGQNKLRN